MVSQPKPYYTPEEYLALERAAPYKSEYLAGEIFAMAGASEEHNTIAANIVRELGNQFQGRPCRVYVSDMRVRVAPAGLYTYPNVVAVCGPREFADAHRDTLVNPTVIFAIPSPIRLTRLGIISTPPALVEAAQAFGATPRQVLTKVELPFAKPQIMAGLTQTIMLSLSMVVIAALVGANGLGVPVVRALNTVNIAKGFDSGLCIVILAIILDRVFRSGDGDAA